MVKYWMVFFFLPILLFSGEFTASVNRNQIHKGENFTLTLTLKNASPSTAPSLDPLRQAFHIHSQHQSSNTMIVNGQVSTNTSWKISLSTKSEGSITIPSINIQTTEGILTSNPISMNIIQGNSASSDSSNVEGLTLITDVSKTGPYKNESLFLTVRLTTKTSLANLQLQKFQIEDAIIEEVGKPKIFKQIVNGINVDTVEWSYLLTPLKAGSLKIPSIILEGAMPIKRQPQSRGSYFDEEGDPFFMLPGFMHGFQRMEPFTMATKEVFLDIQPAVAGLNPWLPATILKIEEIWDDSAVLRVGEPFTRGFKISSEGLLASQLPNLQDLQTSQTGDKNLKIYADKPETGEEFKNEGSPGSIQSFRKEQYTFIPGQAGDIALPEISVAWWDVEKKEKAFARVPSRTISILPQTIHSEGSEIALEEEKNEISLPVHQGIAIQRDPLLYGLLTGLAILLLATIFWVIALQKKIGRLLEKPAPPKIAAKQEKFENPKKQEVSMTKFKPPAKDKKEKLPDLNPT